LRSTLMIPPFAILIVLIIACKQSISDLIKNVKFITTKRKS
jgi:hypothetical protein